MAKLHTMRERFHSLNQDKPGVLYRASTGSRVSTGSNQRVAVSLDRPSAPVSMEGVTAVDKDSRGMLREEGEDDSITWCVL